MDENILHHDDVPDDPHIAMRVIRVMFQEPRHNYQTNINGTRAEIGRHFRGASLNVANFPDEVMRTPHRIEFLDDGDGPTIVMEL